MKIYIAAPYPERLKAKDWALVLVSKGHRVTARWVMEEEDSPDPVDQARYVVKNIDDIMAADVLILMTGYRGDRSWTGGRHWETGFAWARGKQVWICGPRESVFHHLTTVNQIDSIEEFPEA